MQRRRKKRPFIPLLLALQLAGVKELTTTYIALVISKVQTVAQCQVPPPPFPLPPHCSKLQALTSLSSLFFSRDLYRDAGN